MGRAMRVILHSDDAGITSQSTRVVLEAWKAGHLDGFSIIANGDALKQISDALMIEPERKARIAVHLNLTEGRSSAPAVAVPLLVNSDGEMRHSFASLLGTIFSSHPSRRRELLRQIAIECAAQIVAVRSICGTRSVAVIDGHNHIHMLPGVFDVVAQTARDAGIPEIRISREPFFLEKPCSDWLQPFLWINMIKHFLLKILSLSGRRVARRFGLSSPDAIIGVLYSGRMSASRALRGMEAAAGAAKVEIVFHVGRADPSEASRWKHSAYSTFYLSKWRNIERAEVACLSKRMHTSATALSVNG